MQKVRYSSYSYFFFTTIKKNPGELTLQESPDSPTVSGTKEKRLPLTRFVLPVLYQCLPFHMIITRESFNWKCFYSTGKNTQAHTLSISTANATNYFVRNWQDRGENLLSAQLLHGRTCLWYMSLRLDNTSKPSEASFPCLPAFPFWPLDSTSLVMKLSAFLVFFQVGRFTSFHYFHRSKA